MSQFEPATKERKFIEEPTEPLTSEPRTSTETRCNSQSFFTYETKKKHEQTGKVPDLCKGKCQPILFLERPINDRQNACRIIIKSNTNFLWTLLQIISKSLNRCYH